MKKINDRPNMDYIIKDPSAKIRIFKARYGLKWYHLMDRGDWFYFGSMAILFCTLLIVLGFGITVSILSS